MITLGIDTAGPATSVALWRGAGEDGPALAMISEPMKRGHAEAVMPMVRTVVAKALGAGPPGFTAIDRIAVLSGPGSFTGIRIGVAAARGLALAIGCPVVAVTAFEAMAAVFRRDTEDGGAFAIAFDARREQVYLQNFTAGGEPLSAPAAIDLDAVADAVHPDIGVVLGSGSALVAHALSLTGRRLAIGPDMPREAGIVARLGAGVVAAGPPLPLYLRPPDAKPQRPALTRVQN